MDATTTLIQTSSSVQNSLSTISSTFLVGFIGMFAVLIILAIIIWWKIFSKAGYSGFMGLLMFIPLVNLIMLLVLAFGEWPIQKELKQLKSSGGNGMPPNASQFVNYGMNTGQKTPSMQAAPQPFMQQPMQPQSQNPQTPAQNPNQQI